MTRTVRMLMVVLVVVMVKSSDTNECKSSESDKFSDLVERRPIAFPCVRLFDRDGDMGCRSNKKDGMNGPTYYVSSSEDVTKLRDSDDAVPSESGGRGGGEFFQLRSFSTQLPQTQHLEYLYYTVKH